MIITLDIGGTKTQSTFWENGVPVETNRIDTGSVTDIKQLLSAVIGERSAECLCIAAAGPVRGSVLELTNTGQCIDPLLLKKEFPQIPNILLLNDLEAVGYSLDALGPDSLDLLKPGRPQRGTKAVISLGTGLGVCLVTAEGEVLPSEGGHMDFAPGNPQQQKVFSVLRKKYGHVSCERLLSGQGLVNIYAALTGAWNLCPQQVTEKASRGEAAALETMALFSQILGAVCGSYGLIFLASGGIYLGGGIAPKILPLLDRAAFERAFLDKGRLRDLLKEIPVHVILDEMAPSRGAAVYGAKLSSAV